MCIARSGNILPVPNYEFYTRVGLVGRLTGWDTKGKDFSIPNIEKTNDYMVAQRTEEFNICYTLPITDNNMHDSFEINNHQNIQMYKYKFILWGPQVIS